MPNQRGKTRRGISCTLIFINGYFERRFLIPNWQYWLRPCHGIARMALKENVFSVPIKMVHRSGKWETETEKELLRLI